MITTRTDTSVASDPGRSRLGAWLRRQSRDAAPAGSVLFFTHAAAFQAPGGGEYQLWQTGRALEGLGVPVRLFSPWVDRLAEARLLHVFGMSREALGVVRAARAAGIPVVLSPVCWVDPLAMAATERGLARKLVGSGAWGLKPLVPHWPCWRKELLEAVDRILPNSETETRHLVRLFGIDPAKFRTIPNGVEARFAEASPGLFRGRFGSEEFVLYVGRIEPRKNVLGLVRATALAGRPLVVIGAVVPGQDAYAATCRRVGGSRVRWLGGIAHDDPLLASAYAAARVFALPSWFETPGLAALEAALAGCPVVITPRGSARDYFGDRAGYARPGRVREIARAIARAWERGSPPGLAAHVGSHFLWPEVARKTAEVYAELAP